MRTIRSLALAIGLGVLPSLAFAAGTTMFSPQTGGVFIDGIRPSPPPATLTATAVSGAATLNRMLGEVTSESLSTAAGATYTLTLTNSFVSATDTIIPTVQLGTATTGSPAVTTVTPGNGQVVIVVQNVAASAALNGTIKIGFVIFKN